MPPRSSARWRSLPAGHRLASDRIGYEVGWASEFAGSFAMSPPHVQAKAAQVAAARLELARERARRVGIDPDAVVLLASRTPGDLAALGKRFETDEGGLAHRVEERLTPIHRHPFLLGAHVGAQAQTVESSGGELSAPPVTSIRRHATLAGLPAAARQPLVRDERAAAPAFVLEHHRLALEGLALELAEDAPGEAVRGRPAAR
ncbi:MAG: hypothetical protein JO090_08335 [Rhizobacter sp.]|nr:hypothetical protein [Rhizobacter sp.]